MAITPRSKGLGNIGAIVDRQGRASVTAPKAPVKPVVKAAPKPAPRPAPRPVAKVAPKPAPRIITDPAPKMPPTSRPSPFSKKPDTRAPGGGGMDVNGNPIGGGMGAQMNIARPGQGNLARNTGPGNGGPQLVGGAFGKPIFGGPPTGGGRGDFFDSDEYRKLGAGGIDTMDLYTSPYFGQNGGSARGGAQDRAYEAYLQRTGQKAGYGINKDYNMFGNLFGQQGPSTMESPRGPDGRYLYEDMLPSLGVEPDEALRDPSTGFGPGVGYGLNDPELAGLNGTNGGQYGIGYNSEPAPYMPPEPPPGYDYGGPYTPRPDLGPGVGFGVGLPQPGQNTGMFGEGGYEPEYGISNITGFDPVTGLPIGYSTFARDKNTQFAPPPGQGQPQPGGPFGQLNQQLGNTLVDQFTRRLPNMFGGELPPGAEYIPFGGDTGQQLASIGQQGLGQTFGEPAPYTGGMMSPSRVINQVGKPGFQPRTNMSNAFSPQSNNFGGDGFMGGGSGSLFGGGGFAGK